MEVFAMKKDQETLQEVIRSVDDIKYKLWQLAGHLEEAGYPGKAKSLRSIGGRLEDWQHRR